MCGALFLRTENEMFHVEKTLGFPVKVGVQHVRIGIRVLVSHSKPAAKCSPQESAARREPICAKVTTVHGSNMVPLYPGVSNVT